jgi:acetyl-CoA acetyltransferase
MTGIAIVGLGQTEFSRASGRSVLELASEACRLAATDAGMDPRDIDGFLTYGINDTARPQAVAFNLGAREINYMALIEMGGTGPCFMLTTAQAVIKSGLAKSVVLWRAMNGRSGKRIGSAALEMHADEALRRRSTVGLAAAPANFAMWARRYMIETSATYEDIGSVPLTQRPYAIRNPRAMIRKPLSLETYLSSEFIAEPLRLHDCATEVDGACAVIATTAERAADLDTQAVHVAGAAYAHGPRSGLDVFDYMSWEDLSCNSTGELAVKLKESSGIYPNEVDEAQIYDCFSINVLMSLEGLGFAGRGEAGAFLRERNRPGGFPVNTGGGLISEGYLHGMNTLGEGIRRVRSWRYESALEQTHHHCLVTSGGPMWSSGAVLTDEEA